MTEPVTAAHVACAAPAVRDGETDTCERRPGHQGWHRGARRSWLWPPTDDPGPGSPRGLLYRTADTDGAIDLLTSLIRQYPRYETMLRTAFETAVGPIEGGTRA